jgi:hypothetical protein
MAKNTKNTPVVAKSTKINLMLWHNKPQFQSQKLGAVKNWFNFEKQKI